MTEYNNVSQLWENLPPPDLNCNPDRKNAHTPNQIKNCPREEMNFKSEILNIMKNQTEISRKMLEINEGINLPKKTLDLFDGKNILKIKNFKSSFENSMELECRNDGDKLHFSKQ